MIESTTPQRSLWRFSLRNLALRMQAHAFDETRDLPTLLAQTRGTLDLIAADAGLQQPVQQMKPPEPKTQNSDPRGGAHQ